MDTKSVSLTTVRIFLLLTAVFSFTQQFNLDTRIPVYKFGPRDSYFGYSVAEHATLNRHSSQAEPFLLVGAPTWQNTGALFKCPLNTKSRDCDRLDFEPRNASTQNYNVDRENQWLGVTVKSQGPGGYVMVCAHRYVNKGPDFRWGNGICYSLTQFLDLSKSYEPCRNRDVRLAHEQFGFCQSGTSGDISKNSEILLGSPGPYTWRGSVFTNNIRHSIKDDKTWYMSPVIEKESPVEKYSYIGMSVASGDFLQDKSMIFAAGAPRSNGTGEVVFFAKESGSNILRTRGVLRGEQFASSFGYSMAAADVDNDGHADLIVGAPFFYNKTNGGAVYVYLSSDLRSGNFEPSLKLTGKPESRFGFSIANISDLNQDGYDDVAIGAPYEKNGAVYIYLGGPKGLKSQPSQIIEASSLPPPTGRGSRELTTFGYSLSGSLDLDDNDYPDLLVGAYESDAAVLLRSRPIIKIKTQVRGNLTIDPNKNICLEDPSSLMPCFVIEPCFQLLGKSQGYKLQYKIEAETFTGKKHYRTIFQNPKNPDTPNIVVKDISLGFSSGRHSNEMHCSRELVYLKTKQDIQTSIPFKLTYSLVQAQPEMPDEGDSLPNVNEYPILDQEEALKIFEARFVKDCGSDEICDSNFGVRAKLPGARRLLDNNYTMTLVDDFITVDVTAHNFGEPAYDPKLIIEHSSWLSYVSSKKSGSSDIVDCLPDLSNKTVIVCSLQNPFKKSLDFQLKFSTHNMNRQNHFLLNIIANTTSNDRTPHDNEVRFSTQILRRAELELSGVSIGTEVRYGGEVKGESAMKYEIEIGNKLYHKYVVRNSGPFVAQEVNVEIEWPLYLKNKHRFGKWLLYMTQTPSVLNQPGQCYVDPAYVNPKNFLIEYERVTSDESFESEQPRKRYKRESAKIKAVRDKDGNIMNTATLDCDGAAKCIKFHCSILQIDVNRTAIIQIPARLWNATFVEEFSDVHHVNIKSRGKIVLNPLFNIIQSEKDDIFSIETKAFPDAGHVIPEASWWWYLVGIIFGLLILFIIVILLYKVGFFTRDKPPTNYMPVSNGIEREESLSNNK